MKFRRRSSGLYLFAAFFAAVGLGGMAGALVGIVTLTAAGIVFGLIFAVIGGVITAFLLSVLRPVVLSSTDVSVPSMFGRRYFPLADLAGVGLRRSSGKGYGWWVTLWTTDGADHPTPLKARAHGRPEEDLASGRVGASREAAAATAIYRAAVAVQGEDGALRTRRLEQSPPPVGSGSRAAWSPQPQEGPSTGPGPLGDPSRA